MKTDSDALKMDLYELTMAAGYQRHRRNIRATFELFCHTMPEGRSYMVACGLGQVLEYLRDLRFTDEDIDYLRSLPALRQCGSDFFSALRNFRFSGDLWAVEEGEIVFAKEPIIQVNAPIFEAQIVETYLLSMINIQSVVASKAARVVHAAGQDGKPRPVIDFGSRRAHGPEAGVLAARACYLAGCAGTSNMMAGRAFDIPVFGTIAHSWVEAFSTEDEAFSRYHETFPDGTILLIDTYDVDSAMDTILKASYIRDVKAVRIDSGDLLELSRRVRRRLDEAGFEHMKIIVSGNLSEHKIEKLVQENAPVDSFGVGTEMVTSKDNPVLDLTYKLVQIIGEDDVPVFRAKSSQGKKTLPGRKQIFRVCSQDRFAYDVLSLHDEEPPEGAEALLRPFIVNGQACRPCSTNDEIRERARRAVAALDPRLLALDSTSAYEVRLSDKLQEAFEDIQRKMNGKEIPSP